MHLVNCSHQAKSSQYEDGEDAQGGKLFENECSLPQFVQEENPSSSPNRQTSAKQVIKQVRFSLEEEPATPENPESQPTEPCNNLAADSKKQSLDQKGEVQVQSQGSLRVEQAEIEAINREIRLVGDEKIETPVSKTSILNSELLEYLNQGVNDIQNRVFSQSIKNDTKLVDSIQQTPSQTKPSAPHNILNAPLSNKLSFGLKSSTLVKKQSRIENPEECETQEKKIEIVDKSKVTRDILESQKEFDGKVEQLGGVEVAHGVQGAAMEKEDRKSIDVISQQTVTDQA